MYTNYIQHTFIAIQATSTQLHPIPSAITLLSQTSSWSSGFTWSVTQLPSWAMKMEKRIESLMECLSEIQHFKVSIALQKWGEFEAHKFVKEIFKKAVEHRSEWESFGSGEKMVEFARHLEAVEPDGVVAQYCRLFDRISYVDGSELWTVIRDKLDGALHNRRSFGQQFAMAKWRLKVELAGLMPDGRYVFDETITLLECLKRPMVR